MKEAVTDACPYQRRRRDLIRTIAYLVLRARSRYTAAKRTREPFGGRTAAHPLCWPAWAARKGLPLRSGGRNHGSTAAAANGSHRSGNPGIHWGILGILAGLAIIAAGGIVASTGAAVGTTAAASAGGFLLVLGFVTLILAVLDIVFGIGAWLLKPWAWTLGVGLEVVSIIVDILFITQGASIGSEVVGIIIALIVLYYLTRPNVRQAFGRA